MQKEKEPEEVEPEEDDRLYCICKTTYDEDRVMIACDRYVYQFLSVNGLSFICVIGVMNGTIHSA